MILSRNSELAAESACPTCGGPMASKRERGYPALLQTLFGVSFLGFVLFLPEAMRFHRLAPWIWSVVQVGLGFLLVRARLAANRTHLVCYRCGN